MSGARRAWDSTPPPRRLPGMLVGLSVPLLIPSVATTVLRLAPPTDDGTAMLASFIAYGLLTYALALLLLLIALILARRRWPVAILTVLVAVLLAAHMSWLGPYFVPDRRAMSGPAFTVLTLNLHNGVADPREVWAQASEVDIAVLVETTADSLEILETSRWLDRFPYAVGDPSEGVSNTTVYSRFPLSDGIPIGPGSFQQWVLTLQVPEVGNIRLVAVHPCNPYCGGGRWAAEHARLRTTIKPYLANPLIVAGDFNAVDEHGPMLELYADGLRSATDLAGAGWLPTYPADQSYPPVVPIDHILVNNRLTATQIRTFRVTGSDHLGLVATIAAAR